MIGLKTARSTIEAKLNCHSKLGEKMMKFTLMIAFLMAAAFTATSHASETEILKAHKCPKGQHWDSGMKMCMPN